MGYPNPTPRILLRDLQTHYLQLMFRGPFPVRPLVTLPQLPIGCPHISTFPVSIPPLCEDAQARLYVLVDLLCDPDLFPRW